MAFNSESKSSRGGFAQLGSRQRAKVTRTSASGKVYVDYKDTESLRRVISNNGKLLGRRRTGLSAMEQRMTSNAVKRARYMALMPYITPTM